MTIAAQAAVFSTEPLASCIEEILPCLEAHNAECGLFADRKPEPDLGRYLAIEQAGALRCFTMRTMGESHPLVGYSTFLVTPGMHYRESIQALQDVFWVHPDWRAHCGKAFLSYIEESLFDTGCEVVMHFAAPRANLSMMLKHMDYEHRQDVWIKGVC